jgi:hypothetical protein
MPTSIDHYAAAQEHLDRSRVETAPEWALVQATRAVAQATLALAAVTALNSAEGLPLRDYDAWFKTISVEAPIPPETGDEPEEELITEGSVSPGPDDDPDVLAGWLRAVPPGSTLMDVDGDGWYRLVSLSLDGADRRRCHTVVPAGGSGEVRDLGDHGDVEGLLDFAPYTVLTLGTEDGA